MPIARNRLDPTKFNAEAVLPYELRSDDFRAAVQDVYDFFHDVNTHGARDQWMCVFVYRVDNQTEPARERQPMTITAIYLGQVGVDDFRRNARGELGTRTATLHAQGIAKLRQHWIYRV